MTHFDLANKKVLFFGLGSAGCRHFELLRDHFNCKIYRFMRPESVAIDSGITNIFNWNGVAEIHPDIAFICNPTYLHIQTAIECAKLGINTAIEKPLDASIERLGEFLQILNNTNTQSFILYPFRYDKEILLIPKNQRLLAVICRTDGTKWVKDWGHTRAGGGGAILELSHEIDIAEFINGPIQDWTVLKTRYGEVEECAVLTLQHCNGCVSTVYLDIAANSEERKVCLPMYVVNYRATQTTYLAQLAGLNYTVQQHAPLFSQIIAMRE